MRSSENNSTDALAPALCLLAIAAYLLPWVQAANAAMTLNAFDLAEWASLHPLQHSAAPPLLASLLLRVQLPILALCIALWARSRSQRMFAALVALALAAAQLPPLEFLQHLADPNYRQQLALAGATIALAVVLPRLVKQRYRTLLTGLLALLGIVTALAGLDQALALYRATLERGEAGGGLWLIVFAYAGMTAYCLRGFRKPA